MASAIGQYRALDDFGAVPKEFACEGLPLFLNYEATDRDFQQMLRDDSGGAAPIYNLLTNLYYEYGDGVSDIDIMDIRCRKLLVNVLVPCTDHPSLMLFIGWGISLTCERDGDRLVLALFPELKGPALCDAEYPSVQHGLFSTRGNATRTRLILACTSETAKDEIISLLFLGL